MKSIMLATDFSERSDRALRRATLLAEQSNATLSIIHVVDDDQPRRIVDSERQLAMSLLQDLKATVAKVDSVACTSEVFVAAPHAGIARAVTQIQPDLLVIGPHRRQALNDVFVGTTAERTIRSVECPVLMVNAPPVRPYRSALLATDFSEGARRAAHVFEALGMDEGIRVAMFHTFLVPALHLALSHMLGKEERASIVADERKLAAQDLSAFAKSVGKISPVQILRPAERRPALEILAAAKQENADLVVVGTTGESGLLRLFLGSVADEVLRGAVCDVLAVPPKEVTDEPADINHA